MLLTAGIPVYVWLKWRAAKATEHPVLADEPPRTLPRELERRSHA